MAEEKRDSDVRDFICKKCGWEDAEVKYQRWVTTKPEKSVKEFLHCICKRCGFIWREDIGKTQVTSASDDSAVS